MKTIIKDPLLMAGKVIAIFLQAMMGIGAIALIIGMPVLYFAQDDILAEMARESGEAAAGLPMPLLVGVMLVGLAIVALLFLFFDKLRRIIGTVGEGDPFQPANARRLALMGWFMLGVQLLALPATALGLQLLKYQDEADAVNEVGTGFDASGFLMVILLFILARVFRHGAAMREDLEGTV